MRSIILVLVVVSLSSVSLAQPPSSVAPRRDTTVRKKDPAIAVLLSVGGTVGSYVVVSTLASGDNSDAGAYIAAGGLLVGPSIGQWYAGRVGGFGMAARAVGALGILYGFGMMDYHPDFDPMYCDNHCAEAEADYERDKLLGQVAFWGGLSLWVGSTVYDWFAARNAARSWNREHALTIAPAMLGTSARTPGVAMSLQF